MTTATVDTETGEVTEQLQGTDHLLPLSSGQIDQIITAMVAARATFEKIQKKKTAKVKSKRTGTEYSYKYADLADVLDAIDESLAANGLWLFQRHRTTSSGVMIYTTLSHISGQWIGDDGLHMAADVSDAQSVGGAITYGRRYGACSLLGIAADEDTDGHQAKADKSAAKPEPKATQKQRDDLAARIAALSDANAVKIRETVASKFGEWETLTKPAHATVSGWVELCEKSEAEAEAAAAADAQAELDAQAQDAAAQDDEAPAETTTPDDDIPF